MERAGEREPLSGMAATASLSFLPQSPALLPVSQTHLGSTARKPGDTSGPEASQDTEQGGERWGVD